MQNFTYSDYALNKYSDGIVYRFADGITEVKLSDYLAENPSKTKADFRELKELSDSIYLDQVQKENAQTKKNSPISKLVETVAFYSLSPEDAHISKIDAQEDADFNRLRLKTAYRALDRLTDIQKRRYLMYHVDGKTMQEIAELDGVNRSKIMNSLMLADKKIKKVLAESKK